jgi:galactan 5-O-arabinofuranosyltransferase
MPAAAVVFWREVTSASPRRGRLVAVGLYLGAAAATYTLFGFAGALLVMVLAGLAVVLAPGRRWAVLRRAAVCLATAAVPAVAVALLVWAPFLVASLRARTAQNVAARFLPLVSADLPSVLGTDPWKLLLGAGLVALLARLCRPWGRRPEVFLALLVTVALTYGWYAANTLALAFGTTLLAFRFENLVVLVLATGGALAVAEAAGWAREALAARGRRAAGPEADLAGTPRPATAWWGTARPGMARLGVAAVVLGALAATQVVDQRIQSLDDRIDRAYATPYPDGPNARGEVDAHREEGWSDDLAAAIDGLTGAAEDSTVVLSTSYTLLSFHPYRGFQSLIPHYANPLADYEARAAYIHRLADSDTQGDLVSLLDDCPWAPPTAFVFRRADDGLHLRLGSDAFPAAPNTSFADVVFDPALFAGPEFGRVDVGPFVVAVRRG